MSGLVRAASLGSAHGVEFLRGYVNNRAGSLGALLGVVRPSEGLLRRYVVADLVVYYHEQSKFADDDIDYYAVHWGGVLAGKLCRLEVPSQCGIDMPYYCGLIASAIRAAA